ncbi:MAG TPA: GNAT family N-acetyltransferase [Caulobacteraceae bacterium]|nr:GNAT family N-acetyltransferase [Caulobacteraceae bacterium]
MSGVPLRREIRTQRLTLRPSRAGDAAAALAIQADWRVTRMLRAARFPPDEAELAAWFADHQRQWRAGEAYRFAIIFQGRFAGLTDVDEIGKGEGELGYWLAPEAWGHGLATEAGRALVDFAFATASLARLSSGHAADNPASGRVLEKLGFRFAGETRLFSRSRKAEITQRQYRLERPARA